jgi:hypothetical protein
MGAHPYWYFVPYRADVSAALAALREREFRAGRYNPVVPFPNFPVDENSPAASPGHVSIEDAMRDAGDSGTRSILDICRGVSEVAGFCRATPLSAAETESFFGSPEPTRGMIETNLRALSFIERAHCVYVIVYDGGVPSQILFFGYSFD